MLRFSISCIIPEPILRFREYTDAKYADMNACQRTFTHYLRKTTTPTQGVNLFYGA
jgi:hypothetical protein